MYLHTRVTQCKALCQCSKWCAYRKQNFEASRCLKKWFIGYSILAQLASAMFASELTLCLQNKKSSIAATLCFIWNLPKVKSKLDGKKKLGRLKAGGRNQLSQFSIWPANVSDWPHTYWQLFCECNSSQATWWSYCKYMSSILNGTAWFQMNPKT